jgi:6,7-dimethyl-8-ribityllumazine synthase
VRTYPTNRDGDALRFGIVVSRFNHLISAQLLDGAREALAKAAVRSEDVHVAWVPGAFEIPLALRELAWSGRNHGLIALGSVIRGGTPHFDYVCRAVTDGIRDLMQTTGVPVGFGVLTTDDVDQALERAGGGAGNKGAEAAEAAIEMAQLCPRLAEPPPAEAAT